MKNQTTKIKTTKFEIKGWSEYSDYKPREIPCKSFDEMKQMIENLYKTRTVKNYAVSVLMRHTSFSVVEKLIKEKWLSLSKQSNIIWTLSNSKADRFDTEIARQQIKEQFKVSKTGGQK